METCSTIVSVIKYRWDISLRALNEVATVTGQALIKWRSEKDHSLTQWSSMKKTPLNIKIYCIYKIPILHQLWSLWIWTKTFRLTSFSYKHYDRGARWALTYVVLSLHNKLIVYKLFQVQQRFTHLGHAELFLEVVLVLNLTVHKYVPCQVSVPSRDFRGL